MANCGARFGCVLGHLRKQTPVVLASPPPHFIHSDKASKKSGAFCDNGELRRCLRFRSRTSSTRLSISGLPPPQCLLESGLSVDSRQILEYDSGNDVLELAYYRPSGDFGGGAVHIDDGVHLIVLYFHSLRVAYETRCRLHANLHLFRTYAGQ